MNRLTNIVLTCLIISAVTAAPVAAANTVRSVNIVDGQVKTPDLAKAAVTTKKLASNAVTGAKLDESTLGIVPNANLLDGRDSTSFVAGTGRVMGRRVSINRGATAAIFTAAFADQIGFNIAYRCPGGSPSVQGLIEFRNRTGTAWELWYQDGGDAPVYVQVPALGTEQFPANEQYHSVTIRLARLVFGGGTQANIYFSVNDALTTCKANGLVIRFS